MEKKGQAAMEFLMTYGWAILAAIIAIGVLAYFGVFSPGKYVSGSAVVSAPFYANAWNVKADAVNLELRNNGGEIYNISSVDVLGCGTADFTLNNKLVNASASATVAVSCTSPLTGTSFKGDITVNYKKIGSSISLTSTGTIAEKITA